MKRFIGRFIIAMIDLFQLVAAILIADWIIQRWEITAWKE